jgi:MbtH protein
MTGMDDHTSAAGIEYAVVVNDEEQYSVWRADRKPPAGWRAVGTSGSKEACLEHIASVWTDMRPLSLRRRMDAEGVR